MSDLINQNRIERDKVLFDKIFDQYCRKDIVSSSRIARATRLKQTIIRSDRNTSNLGDVLEVGCGGGFSVDYLHGMFDHFTGLDYSKNLINLANKSHNLSNAEFLHLNFSDFDSAVKFDTIFMIGVLHHMPTIDSAICKCYHLLKPNGWLIVNEPQPTNSILQFLRKMRTYLDSSYSDEQDQIQGDLLSSIFTKNGFSKVRTYGQGLFSTPFAEVILSPQLLAKPISHLACGIDIFLESNFASLIKNLTWNVIVSGQKPSIVA